MTTRKLNPDTDKRFRKTAKCHTSGGKVNHFKARVTVECIRIGWTLQDLARALDMKNGAFHPILRRGAPTMATVERIAEALGVEPAVLLKKVTAAEYGRAVLPRFEEAP